MFRLADALQRPCDGSAAPYLALMACTSTRLRPEMVPVNPGGGWGAIQRLRREGATGKLLVRGRAGETFLYLIGGRYLRLEADYPPDVSPDMVRPSDASYRFERSGLRDDEVSLVLRRLEQKWLGATPTQDVDSASASR